MDSHTKDAIANTFSISSLFAFMMEFQAEITILLLITGLFLNVMRIYDRFKKGDRGGESKE